jgi:hypothetical protein
MRILKHGKLVVEERIVVQGPAEWSHAGRRSEHRHDRVDQVAPQFEHRAAPVRNQLVAARLVQLFAHHSVQLEDPSQPALTDGSETQFERGIVAQHVAHLDGPAARAGFPEDCRELREGLTGGLVEMNVQPCGNAAGGRRQQVFDFRFHEHGGQAFCIQQLLFRDPADIRELVFFSESGTQRLVRLADAHQFEHLRMVQQRFQLSAGVRMADAHLPNADPARRAGCIGPWGDDRSSGKSTRFQKLSALHQTTSGIPNGSRCRSRFNMRFASASPRNDSLDGS